MGETQTQPAPPQAALVGYQAAPGSLGVKTFDLDMDEIKRQAAEIKKTMATRRPSDFFSFKAGLNHIRILPPWSEERKWTKYAATHFQLAGDVTTTCYEGTYPGMGFQCPVCQVIAAFENVLPDNTERWKASGYRYANGLVCDWDGATSSFTYQRLKPFVIRIPATVYAKLLQLMALPYIGSIVDVDRGWVVNVTRPESFKGKATYEVQQAQQGPLASDAVTATQILNQMHNLDRFGTFGIPTVDRLKQQTQIAEAVLTSCLAITGWQRNQVPGLPAQLEYPVPPVVYETHGVTGGQSVPQAPPPVAAAPVVVPVASTVAAVPSTSAVVPVATVATVGPPIAAPVPAPTAASPMPGMQPPPGAPAPPAFAPSEIGTFPGMPPPTAMAPVAQATPPMAPPPAAQPPVAPPQAAPVAAAPVIQPVTAEAQEVVCPKCGRTFGTIRGLKLHMSKSPECAGTAPTVGAAPSAQPPPAPSPVAAPSGAPVIGPDGQPNCWARFNIASAWCGACVQREDCRKLTVANG